MSCLLTSSLKVFLCGPFVLSSCLTHAGRCSLPYLCYKWNYQFTFMGLSSLLCCRLCLSKKKVGINLSLCVIRAYYSIVLLPSYPVLSTAALKEGVGGRGRVKRIL